MNFNKTHRLTIVDKQHIVRQLVIVKGSKSQTSEQKGNSVKIYRKQKAA